MGVSDRRLTASIELAKSVDEVWAMLTEGPKLEQWFCEKAEVDLASGKYLFWGSHTPGTPGRDDGHLELLGYEPTKRLALSWRIRGSETNLEYTLEPAGSGTLLSVNHSGLPDREEHQGAMHDLWYTTLENLRLYAHSGEKQFLPHYGRKRGPEITTSVEINGSAADVWDKFMNPQQMDRYFGEGMTVELQAGGKIDYGWGEECGPVKILALDEPNSVTYSWHYKDEPDTVVTWQLAESQGRTRLTIVHSGFDANFESEGYLAGWFSFLAIIKGMVELGEDWEMVEIKGLAHGGA